MTKEILLNRYEVFLDIPGGNSRIAFAYDTHDSDHRVAIKIVRFGLHDPQQKRDLLMREPQILKKLGRHPHITALLDSVYKRDEDTLYLVMPFYEGDTLQQYCSQLRNRQAEPEEMIRAARQLASGLAYIHSRPVPVLHRDIKPDNIIRRIDGTYVLVDFGISTELEEGQKRKTNVGTELYLPPEVRDGRGWGKYSDFFCLGEAIYEALVGEPPWGTSTQTAYEAQGRGDPPAYPGWFDKHKPLSDILRRCLELEPGRRPQDANEILDALGYDDVVRRAPSDEGTTTRVTIADKLQKVIQKINVLASGAKEPDDWREIIRLADDGLALDTANDELLRWREEAERNISGRRSTGSDQRPRNLEELIPIMERWRQTGFGSDLDSIEILLQENEPWSEVLLEYDRLNQHVIGTRLRRLQTNVEFMARRLARDGGPKGIQGRLDAMKKGEVQAGKAEREIIKIRKCLEEDIVLRTDLTERYENLCRVGFDMHHLEDQKASDLEDSVTKSALVAAGENMKKITSLFAARAVTEEIEAAVIEIENRKREEDKRLGMFRREITADLKRFGLLEKHTRDLHAIDSDTTNLAKRHQALVRLKAASKEMGTRSTRAIDALNALRSRGHSTPACDALVPEAPLSEREGALQKDLAAAATAERDLDSEILKFTQEAETSGFPVPEELKTDVYRDRRAILENARINLRAHETKVSGIIERARLIVDEANAIGEGVRFDDLLRMVAQHSVPLIRREAELEKSEGLLSALKSARKALAARIQKLEEEGHDDLLSDVKVALEAKKPNKAIEPLVNQTEEQRNEKNNALSIRIDQLAERVKKSDLADTLLDSIRSKDFASKSYGERLAVASTLEKQIDAALAAAAAAEHQLEVEIDKFSQEAKSLGFPVSDELKSGVYRDRRSALEKMLRVLNTYKADLKQANERARDVLEKAKSIGEVEQFDNLKRIAGRSIQPLNQLNDELKRAESLLSELLTARAMLITRIRKLEQDGHADLLTAVKAAMDAKQSGKAIIPLVDQAEARQSEKETALQGELERLLKRVRDVERGDAILAPLKLSTFSTQSHSERLALVVSCKNHLEEAILAAKEAAAEAAANVAAAEAAKQKEMDARLSKAMDALNDLRSRGHSTPASDALGPKVNLGERESALQKDSAAGATAERDLDSEILMFTEEAEKSGFPVSEELKSGEYRNRRSALENALKSFIAFKEELAQSNERARLVLEKARSIGETRQYENLMRIVGQRPQPLVLLNDELKNAENLISELLKTRAVLISRIQKLENDGHDDLLPAVKAAMEAMQSNKTISPLIDQAEARRSERETALQGEVDQLQKRVRDVEQGNAILAPLQPSIFSTKPYSVKLALIESCRNHLEDAVLASKKAAAEAVAKAAEQKVLDEQWEKIEQSILVLDKRGHEIEEVRRLIAARQNPVQADIALKNAHALANERDEKASRRLVEIEPFLEKIACQDLTRRLVQLRQESDMIPITELERQIDQLWNDARLEEERPERAGLLTEARAFLDTFPKEATVLIESADGPKPIEDCRTAADRLRKAIKNKSNELIEKAKYWRNAATVREGEWGRFLRQLKIFENDAIPISDRLKAYAEAQSLLKRSTYLQLHSSKVIAALLLASLLAVTAYLLLRHRAGNSENMDHVGQIVKSDIRKIGIIEINPQADDLLDVPRGFSIVDSSGIRLSTGKFVGPWIIRNESTGYELLLIPPLPSETFAVRPFWMGRTEVTNAQFRQLFKDHHSDSYYLTDGEMSWSLDADMQPVIATRRQAEKFCLKTGMRLPKRAEWIWAARGTARSIFAWGDDWPPAHKIGNFADATAERTFSDSNIIQSYDDGWAVTAPVGSITDDMNSFTLQDMWGNVAEHCLDNPSIVLGGSWMSPDSTPAAYMVEKSIPPLEIGFRAIVLPQKTGSSR